MHERAAHVFADYAFEDRMHKMAHMHNDPLVVRKCQKSVTERIDTIGGEVIPLYEDEAAKVVEELLDENVDVIAICFHYSFMNPSHEIQMREIAKEVMKKRGVNIPVHVSHEVAPLLRENSRAFSVVLNAYAADMTRKQLEGIEKKCVDNGYTHRLNVMLASGAVVEPDYQRLYETLFAAPVGGLLAGKYVCEQLGIKNLICTDQGGTSFDVGIIKAGVLPIVRETEAVHYRINLPTVEVDTIASGTCMHVALDPATGRVKIGPTSAQAVPGPVCYNTGGTQLAVLDCILANGIVNPDNYLGGTMKIYPDLALKAIKEQCSDKLGLDPHAFAEGIYDLICARLKEQTKTSLAGKGYTAGDFHCIAYGGGGPLFCCGYTEGLPFKSVFTVPFTGAFSAFGLTSVDYSRRFHQSSMIAIPFGAPDEHKMMMGGAMSMIWNGLVQRGIAECVKAGYAEKDIEVERIIYMRYGNQLEDLEVVSPIAEFNSPADVDKLIEVFDTNYAKVYSKAAAHPQAGYTALEMGVNCNVRRIKPRLPEYPLEGPNPPSEAQKGTRKVYQKGKWEDARIYEMGALRPGNVVEGLAVIEDPFTTFFVPANRKVRVDSRKFLYIENV